MANIDQNYDGYTRLKNWYPKVKNNFSTINTQLEEHVDNTDNPHAVTKAQVGLPNADDTSDLNKPISNAARAALDTKADKAEVEAALETKADKSYVDGALADKADGAAVYAALDTKADKQTKDGGFCAGADSASITGGAVGWQSKTEYGGAVGTMAKSASGGAAGAAANSTSGGAVGDNAKAGAGFAGGKYARATDANNDEGIDAIQLGTGTNSAPKTLQVYSHQLMDANGKIPLERLDDTLAKQLPHITWDGLDSFTGRAALVHDDEDDIAIYPSEATNGTRNTRAHLLLQSTFYPIKHDGSIQDEPFQDGSESYLQTLYKLDGTVQQRRYEAYGSNPNVWSAWEIVGHAHTHANATVLDAITAASLVGTKGVNIDSPGNDVTDLDSLPNGLTQVPYSDGAGAGGYLVFTSLERGGGNVGYQIKISKDATLWRSCSYGEWGAWQMQTDALLAPIVTKTDTGTAFYFASPGVYQLQRTTDAAKQLTFYTPSDAQKTKVNELELYLTVTAGDSVLWPAGTLFTGGEIPTFTPGHYYRVIAEYHPIAQSWCVGVVEDFAAA